MELTKNIFFNTDKLIENSRIKISYTGKFFQDESEEVFIHYGFGENWDNVNDIEMEKTEIGFQAEIDLPEYDTFNFCFRNNNNEWDDKTITMEEDNNISSENSEYNNQGLMVFTIAAVYDWCYPLLTEEDKKYPSLLTRIFFMFS